MKKVVGSTTTYYVGNWYEITNGAITKYYYFGAQRVAMKQGSAVTYLHGDHLGSTSVASNGITGALVSRQTYYAFGGVRTTEGTLPTDYTFTGQKNDASSALMFYNARYYDANIGRFVQADPIVAQPFNPQSLNRFAYVLNNPINYVDPSGYKCIDPDKGFESDDGGDYIAGTGSGGTEGDSGGAKISKGGGKRNGGGGSCGGQGEVSDELPEPPEPPEPLKPPKNDPADNKSGAASDTIGIEPPHSLELATVSGGIADPCRMPGIAALDNKCAGGKIGGSGDPFQGRGPWFNGGGGSPPRGGNILPRKGDWRPLGAKDLPPTYQAPKGGARKVTVQHGPMRGRSGWLDKDGNIWVSSSPTDSHGGPHWDVQRNGGRGGYYNEYPPE